MAREYNILRINEMDELSVVRRPAQPGADAVAIGKSNEEKIVLVDINKGRTTGGRQAHQAMACPDCGDNVDAGCEDCPTCGANVPIHKTDDQPITPAVRPDIPVAFGKRYFDSHERKYLARSGAAMPNGGFPITDATDLHNAIQAFGRAKNKSSAAAHIKQRARALNLTSMLPKDGELAGLAKSDNPKEPIMSDDLQKKYDELAKQHSIAKRLLDLPYDQQVYALRLNETRQEAFLAKSAPDRESEAKPVYIGKSDGVRYYHTDDDRIVKQAKRLDEQDEKFAKQAEAEEIRKFEQEATTILKNFKGSITAKAKLLQLVSKVADEAQRKEITEMLKSHDNGLAAALRAMGVTVTPETEDADFGKSDGGNDVIAKWEKAVEDFAKANNIGDDFEQAEGQMLSDKHFNKYKDLYAQVDQRRIAIERARHGN